MADSEVQDLFLYAHKSFQLVQDNPTYRNSKGWNDLNDWNVWNRPRLRMARLQLRENCFLTKLIEAIQGGFIHLKKLQFRILPRLISRDDTHTGTRINQIHLRKITIGSRAGEGKRNSAFDRPLHRGLGCSTGPKRHSQLVLDLFRHDFEQGTNEMQ